MLEFREAQARLLAAAPRSDDDVESRSPQAANLRAAERIGLDGSAGRVLAEDIACPSDLPSFDGSTMDGYAVRAADFAGAGPWEFPVRGESRAGGSEPVTLPPAAVSRIFTGAALPPGADSVVMQEHVERAGDLARFVRAVQEGQCVRHRGDDLRAGAVALQKGTRLRPAHVALAASLDRAWLTVARRPRVVVIATGDELRSPGTPGRRGSIPDSNTLGIAAMARRAGAEVTIAPFVGDELGATKRAFETAMLGADVLVSVGGVSVGDHDRVRPALEAIGVTLDFYKVAMKPGKPLALGKRGSTLVLALPGNPVSAMVTFAMFGIPLLRTLQGDRDPLPRTVHARAGRSLTREPGRLEFARAALTRDGASWTATPLGNQASGAVAALAVADALLVIPADRTELRQGDDVEIYLLEELCA